MRLRLALAMSYPGLTVSWLMTADDETIATILDLAKDATDA